MHYTPLYPMRHETSTRTNSKAGESAIRQAAPSLRIDTSYDMETLHRASVSRGHPQLPFGGRPVPPAPGFRPLVMDGSHPYHHPHRPNHGERPVPSRQPYVNHQPTYPAAWPVHQHHVRQHNANEESGGRPLAPLSGMPLHVQTQQGAATGVQRLQYPSIRPLSRPETHNDHRLDAGERHVARLHEEINTIKATVKDMEAQIARLKQIVETNVEDDTRLLECQRRHIQSTRDCDRCQQRSVESVNEIDARVLESVECGHSDVQVVQPRITSAIVTKRELSTQDLEPQPRQRSKHEPKRYNLRTRGKKKNDGQIRV
jgi:hypothetical protein